MKEYRLTHCQTHIDADRTGESHFISPCHASDFYCEFAAAYKQNFIEVIMWQQHTFPLLTAFKYDQVFPCPLPRKIKLHRVSSQNAIFGKLGPIQNRKIKMNSYSLLIHCTRFKQHWNFHPSSGKCLGAPLIN